MSTPLDDAALLAAELLARRWLPRQHPRVRRALIDAELWQATQQRLAEVGLRLAEEDDEDSGKGDQRCADRPPADRLLEQQRSEIEGDERGDEGERHRLGERHAPDPPEEQEAHEGRQ